MHDVDSYLVVVVVVMVVVVVNEFRKYWCMMWIPICNSSSATQLDQHLPRTSGVINKISCKSEYITQPPSLAFGLGLDQWENM